MCTRLSGWTRRSRRRRIQGARAAGFGDDGEVVAHGAPVSVGPEAMVTEVGGFRFFFGWRSDPFFFDAMGNFNQMQFTGDDFFKNKNVCSIVLELPNSELPSNEVGIWARTVDNTGEGWVQADRGGRPLQAVFLVGEEREAYLSGEPVNDDRFISVCSRTSWNTQAAILRRTQRPSQESCCQILFRITRTSRRAFRTMVER
jgi:uncharacterized protein DUF4331